MMSLQLILLNLIYDLSCTAIPWDNVDEEFVAIPRKWDASSVGSFMMWLGPTSSIFDFTTYAFMYFIFCPIFVSHGVLFNDLAAHYSGAELTAMQIKYIGMFQAGWFVESMVEPNAGHSYDSDAKAAIHPKPCISSGHVPYHSRYCRLDGDSIFTAGTGPWLYGFAGHLFCLSDSMYSAVHDVGNEREKSIRSPLWRAAVGGVNHDTGLGRPLDRSFWKRRITGNQYGILGRYGSRSADCHRNERRCLGHETQGQKRRINVCIIHDSFGVLKH